MDNRLEAIQSPICRELDLLNDLLREVLRSSDPLLNRIVESYLEKKGKQMRPVLVLLTARLLGTPNRKSIDAAMAVELLHNASLIHDDVVDDTPVRRGTPSVNAKWGNKMAVLVGDYFVSTALNCALATGDVRVIEALGALGRSLALGEIEQLDNLQRISLDEASYFRVISRKTASLFIACMQVGALSVEADAGRRALLETFGEKLGCCFQIKDDIFDYFGGAGLGKPTGNDLREGKITLPLIYALNRCSASCRERALALLEKHELAPEEVAELVALAKQEGGIAYAEQKMEQLRDEALHLLDRFPDEKAVTALRELLFYTLERTH